MNRFEYSRLCLLIHKSLHPHTEKLQVSITQEQEKDLLITLSQVLKQIKFWTHEFDFDSNDVEPQDMLVKVAGNSGCPVDLMCHSLVSHCLTKIISDLVFFLAIKSRYVQHLAGNVLVAISQFVVASESYWDEFMHAICFFLELAICNSLSHSLDPPSRAKDINFDSSTSISDTRPILKNASWYSVSSIILVLRNVLKHLKHLQDDQLFEVYLNSIGSFLPNVPWDLCNEICVGQIGDVRQPKHWFEFCGHLVQFFCSLVAQSSSVKDAGGCLGKHPAIREICIIIPKVLAWCLGKQGDCSNTCISQYIRHKILVLMIRLSSQVDLDCEMAISWLHLIHSYFQDLLLEPVTQSESGQDDCLEGSPFLLSLSDVEVKPMSNCHLQRLVICLFLRCSVNLISLRERTKEHCLCGNLNSCLVLDQNCGPKCYRKKGLMELYEWLQKHLPADILVNSQLYSERCRSFTKSFLQLYMHEDDLLFEVLLQLSYMPFGSEQQIFNERTYWVVEDDTLVLLSDLFNPIYLFHLFLAELLYDHHVLLDYLISKDTGASCAEYLLRCMRMICGSWNSFLGFSFGGEIRMQLSCKKRKVAASGLDLHQELSSAVVKSKGFPLSSEMDFKREHMHGCKHQRISRLPFEDAKECLLSLKKSVESLHQKDLFPYNPEVLLRRLQRFQELCPRE